MLDGSWWSLGGCCSGSEGSAMISQLSMEAGVTCGALSSSSY